jgi:hypothetical protein
MHIFMDHANNLNKLPPSPSPRHVQPDTDIFNNTPKKIQLPREREMKVNIPSEQLTSPRALQNFATNPNSTRRVRRGVVGEGAHHSSDMDSTLQWSEEASDEVFHMVAGPGGLALSPRPRTLVKHATGNSTNTKSTLFDDVSDIKTGKSHAGRMTSSGNNHESCILRPSGSPLPPPNPNRTHMYQSQVSFNQADSEIKRQAIRITQPVGGTTDSKLLHSDRTPPKLTGIARSSASLASPGFTEAFGDESHGHIPYGRWTGWSGIVS